MGYDIVKVDTAEEAEQLAQAFKEKEEFVEIRKKETEMLIQLKKDRQRTKIAKEVMDSDSQTLFQENRQGKDKNRRYRDSNKDEDENEEDEDENEEDEDETSEDSDDSDDSDEEFKTQQQIATENARKLLESKAADEILSALVNGKTTKTGALFVLRVKDSNLDISQRAALDEVLKNPELKDDEADPILQSFGLGSGQSSTSGHRVRLVSLSKSKKRRRKRMLKLLVNDAVFDDEDNDPVFAQELRLKQAQMHSGK